MPVLGDMILLTDHTTSSFLRQAPAQSNLPFQAVRYASPLTVHELRALESPEDDRVSNPLAPSRGARPRSRPCTAPCSGRRYGRCWPPASRCIHLHHFVLMGFPQVRIPSSDSPRGPHKGPFRPRLPDPALCTMSTSLCTPGATQRILLHHLQELSYQSFRVRMLIPPVPQIGVNHQGCS